MTQQSESYPEPQSAGEVMDADAGSPSESGVEATMEAMMSPEKYRLSMEQVQERDDQFSSERKSQGPFVDDSEAASTPAQETQADETDETPIPEVAEGDTE
jgi:hypothetical protein